MSSCTQCTHSAHHLIKWALIDTSFRGRTVFFGYQVDQWEFREQLFWLRISELVFLIAPSGSFDIQSINIASSRWSGLDVLWRFVINVFVFKGQSIYGYYVFSCVVLKCTGDEGLREEEAWHPESDWCTLVNPTIQEFDSIT